jgi:hypothetical protein
MNVKIVHVKPLIISLVAVLLVAISVRVVIPVARERGECVALGKQWMSFLKQHPDFSAQETGYPVEVTFLYAEPTDENLTKLRDQYDLETIAGQGSESDQIINLMSWVYGLAEHANEPAIPSERNAFAFIYMAQVEQKQINCYMKTVILNEVYLSMGFCSRRTHLLPHSHEERESHFVTSVYSRTLEKWILMDPDFGVYVTDEKGNILGVMEIRRRLISGEPLKVQHPGRSCLEIAWGDVHNFIQGVDYPWFLSEFVFKIRCPKYSRFGQGTESVREYFELIPDGYRPERLGQAELADRGKKIYSTNDEDAFWARPARTSY